MTLDPGPVTVLASHLCVFSQSDLAYAVCLDPKIKTWLSVACSGPRRIVDTALRSWSRTAYPTMPRNENSTIALVVT
ncbi:hypothetical protein AUEXF2481DRAFT_41404 [Aureobasidium subglaciale EXF-2481]|uniref:Uncharacterized protein n=1 Tax=Aureobasidium subglaciale (strain EXF-2481) TaxID=1043005 RepID=A0A074Y8X9_AURSE|nr:uncharacterized protein AUEXF2481DRAFT_41404 [Aureobasidium subglaciale EXF-2481]KEQ94223.1 hypothetical protein AUEXF2481DRAFT_41404 [Aureobasidium subglaciale EXF-2481]